VPKLLLNVGLPASGKSSYAKGRVEKDKKLVRFNNDDLRSMMGVPANWSGDMEDIVRQMIVQGASAALKHGLDVIIDNTNLTEGVQERWKQVALAHKSKFEIVDFRKVPVDTCIGRDRLRQHPDVVGRSVIETMALKAGLIAFDKRPIVICDVDGTLANNTKGRSPYDESKVHMDEPYEVIVKWVNNLTHHSGYCMECYRALPAPSVSPLDECPCVNPRPVPEYQVIIVSGRSTRCAIPTEHWLSSRLTYTRLFMRMGGDRRPDVEVKQEILNGILAKVPKEQISFVLDDRPSVCRMWKENGLTVYPVRGQVEEF
jgi:predicted kinase